MTHSAFLGKEGLVLLGILLGLGGFCVFLVLHWTLFHWRLVRPNFKNVLGIWSVSLLVSWLVCYLAASSSLSREVIGVPLVRGMVCFLVFACCFVLYMPLYYVIATSLSVQTIIAILEAGPEGRSLDILKNVFGSNDLLRKRLETLVTNGYLIHDGDRFRATRKGVRISHVFFWLKNLWRLGPGG